MLVQITIEEENKYIFGRDEKYCAISIVQYFFVYFNQLLECLLSNLIFHLGFYSGFLKF